MSVVSAIKGLLASRRIADIAALQMFMESRAAVLVQKSITGYTKTRTNKLFSTLIYTSPHLDGYEAVRWQSFPAAMSMIAEMIEGSLRECQGTAPGQLDGALVSMVGAIVSRYPQASRRSDAFWQKAVDLVARDLARSAQGRPVPVHELPCRRAEEIFDLLPVPSQLRHRDLPLFLTIVSLHLAEIKTEFETNAAPASLVANLSA